MMKVNNNVNNVNNHTNFSKSDQDFEQAQASRPYSITLIGIQADDDFEKSCLVEREFAHAVIKRDIVDTIVIKDFERISKATQAP